MTKVRVEESKGAGWEQEQRKKREKRRKEKKEEKDNAETQSARRLAEKRRGTVTQRSQR
jgi:hypothetical protein